MPLAAPALGWSHCVVVGFEAADTIVDSYFYLKAASKLSLAMETPSYCYFGFAYS